MLRRDILRYGLGGFAIRGLLLEAGDGCPTYTADLSCKDPIQTRRVTAPQAAGSRTSLETFSNGPYWNALKAAYEKIRNGNGAATLTGQQCLHKLCDLDLKPSLHGSAHLLLWHRWFLYFHEQLLRAQGTGLPNDFALPYWQGSLDPNLPLPDTFNDPALDPLQQNLQLISYAGTAQQATTVTQGLRNASNYDSAQKAIYSWHGEVHNLAAVLRKRLPQLQYIQSSPGDPLFFFFHSQLDRLFECWRNVVKPVDDAATFDTTYVFWDLTNPAKPSCVRVRAGDAINLRYTYLEPCPPALGPQSKRVKISGLQIRSAELRDGAGQYNVLIQRPGGPEQNLGFFNVVHGTEHANQWKGWAVYPLPAGVQKPAGLRVILRQKTSITLRNGKDYSIQ